MARLLAHSHADNKEAELGQNSDSEATVVCIFPISQPFTSTWYEFSDLMPLATH